MNTAAVTKVEPGINAGLDFILNLMQKSIEILPTERDKSVHAPIAVFDSGVGGLTVARHIRTLLPQENLLYFADCAWTPYGPRNRSLDKPRMRLRWAKSISTLFRWFEAV